MHTKNQESFPKKKMHISLLNGNVHLYGESVGKNTTHYSSEVRGKIVNEFTDGHEINREYVLSYFVTALFYIKDALNNQGISHKGIEKEAAWNISWAQIKTK